jgi:hypothetical protein
MLAEQEKGNQIWSAAQDLVGTYLSLCPFVRLPRPPDEHQQWRGKVHEKGKEKQAEINQDYSSDSRPSRKENPDLIAGRNIHLG